MALVLRGGRGEAVPDHGHLLADRNRRLHDDSDAWQPRYEAWFMHFANAWGRSARSRSYHWKGARRESCYRGSRVRQILAVHVADCVREPHAHVGDVFEALPRLLSYRRCVRPRQRRELLDYRSD